MKIRDALKQVSKLYMDTAPLIYYVEEHPNYVSRMQVIIELLDSTPMTAVSSVITITEVLKHPIEQGQSELEKEYRAILTGGQSFALLPISLAIADRAAHLRAKYNLRTPDALHIASALESRCDAFLTNDYGIKRVTELRILILDALEVPVE